MPGPCFSSKKSSLLDSLPSCTPRCSLQTVVNILEPLGYQLLHLEHLYAVFAHENVVPLLRQQELAGPAISTFDIWRQGWHCSPFSRYLLGLEALLGFDFTWLSPDGKGKDEKGLGCIRSFREFLTREGLLISANYTGKDSCEDFSESSASSAAWALQRRLNAVQAITGTSRGLASAQVLAQKQTNGSPNASSMWCWYQLSSHCACLPPFRGSRCDMIDRSKDDEARKFQAGLVMVMKENGPDAIQDMTARLKNLSYFNSQPGRGYPVIIFHLAMPEDALEKLAIASDNRIWFVELQVAKGRPPSSAMQWFRFSEMLSHPALKGLEILWDVSESLRDEDPIPALYKARLAPAACWRQPMQAPLSYRRGRLEEITELFLLHHGKEWRDFDAAGGVNLLTGVTSSKCPVWRRRSLATSEVFKQFVRFLEDHAVGIDTPYDVEAVRMVGAAVTAFLTRGGSTRALLLT
ncbi:unnamed protein product [Durusdinium trenchii]|uniref:Uncharacterized protein n=1 Tax=Durusdinium trenchii TaxID=1381693 RepID=A0ABP0RY84_9DINO